MIRSARTWDGEMSERLLSTARAGASTQAQAAAVDYDWSNPCRFTATQRGQLGSFSAEIARAASIGLEGLLHATCELSPAEITQHFAGKLTEETSQRGEFWTGLSVGPMPGLLCLPPGVAIGWVQKLLGGSEQAQADRQLSSLESSLLSDLMGVLAKEISSALKTRRLDCRPGNSVTRGECKLSVADDVEYCHFGLTAGPGDAPPVAVRVVLPADVVETLLAGKATAKATPADELRRRMIRYVEQVNVSATAWLGQTDMPMGELLTLAEGDVVLLDMRPGDAMSLEVQGTTLAAGLVTQSQGRYAMKVVAVASAPQAKDGKTGPEAPAVGKDSHVRSIRPGQ